MEAKFRFQNLDECATCGHPRWEHLNDQRCTHEFCTCETFQS